MTRASGALVWMTLVSGIGCGGEMPADPETSEDAVLASVERRPKQGPLLTGTLQRLLTHQHLVRVSARHPDGSLFSSLSVARGELRVGSAAVPAASIAGTTFITRDARYRYRVAAMVPVSGVDHVGTVYRVEYQRAQSSGWGALCLAWTGTDLVNESLPIRGYFEPATDTWIDDPGYLTFVCRDSAAFKAVSWGYAAEVYPDHFRAAVRAARADYCGGGSAYTRPGTEIAIFDLDGIRADPGPADGMSFEAAWQPDDARGELPINHGAICLSKRRWDTLSPTTPAPGTAACNSLPYAYEFAQVCAPGHITDPTGYYPQPSIAQLQSMRAAGARVFTRSRNMQ